MTQFEGIEPPLGVALAKRGYSTLTPVQDAVLDPALAGRDALVSAQTGSGKTVAFGLAMAPDLLKGRSRLESAGEPLALAIAPTRELALQVARELTWLYAEAGATVATCVGGMDPRSERRVLERGAHIVVGTPGRLRDHITRGALDLSGLRAVVLDEADEMLDLGFREDLEFILEASPIERRTLMFSATVPKQIAALAQSYQRDAARIMVQSGQKQHVDIEYRALAVAPSDRDNAIVNVLRYYEAQTAIIFCNTRAAVNHLTARLHNRGFTVVALSGELSQNERTHALQAMRDGRARVCIATDVAARGIDLPNLELVVHADLPTNPETLLHRSGRTGRAGRKGVSALIVPASARRKAERVLHMASIKAQWAAPPSADDVNGRDDERLVKDDVFADPIRDEERDFVHRLIETHGAEKVAAAFVRLYRAGHSAPEDLIDIGPVFEGKPPRAPRMPASEDSRPGRDDFASATWISLSVGRKQNAEPRWLIPLLCRAGQMTKREIGAIKMHPEETHVQIAENAIDGFLMNIGPNRTIERGIRVNVFEGRPETPKPSRAAARNFSDRSAPAPRGDAAGDLRAAPAKKAFGRKTEFAGDRNFSDRPGKDWAKPGAAEARDGLRKKKKAKSNAR